MHWLWRCWLWGWDPPVDGDSFNEYLDLMYAHVNKIFEDNFTMCRRPFKMPVKARSSSHARSLVTTLS